MITVIKEVDGPGIRTAIDLINDTRRRSRSTLHLQVETAGDVLKLLEKSLAEARPQLERTGVPADDDTIAMRAARLLDAMEADQRTKGPYEKMDLTRYHSAMTSLRAALDGAYVPFRKPDLETHERESYKGGRGSLVETHESFGIMSVHRVSGGGGRALFGSELSMHPHFIEIRIDRAEQHHDGVDGNHTYMPYHSRGAGDGMVSEVATVMMSTAQFAEMITTMNVGSGTPCTIARVAGVDMTPIPHTESAFNKAYKSALGQLTEAKDEKKIQKLLAEAREILDKKSLVKADRHRLASIMSELADGGASLASWATIQLQEARDKTVSVMKQELGGLASAMLTNLGLAALKDDPSALLRLTSGPTKEES